MPFACFRAGVRAGGARRCSIAFANIMIAALAALSSSVGSWAQSIDAKVVTPFFSAPIPTKWPPTEDRNPTLADLLRSNKDSTVLLVDDIARAALLVGADQT